MNRKIKRTINDLNYRWHKPRVNWIKTVFFNFMTLPFKEAKRLPVIIYGSCSIGCAMGQVKLLSPAHYGMLKIGISDKVRSCHSKSYISLNGTLEIDDNTVLRRGIHLSITKDAIFRMHKHAFISDNNTIIVKKLIEIGNSVRVGNNTTFMDTDFHYVINTNTREVKQNKKPIIIGTNCWIGGWCTIKKGTKLPKGTIVAGPNSMTSKDYTSEIGECCLIAGSPAKPLVQGMRRVNNINSNKEIYEHYKNNINTFILSQDRDIESFCMPSE